MRRRSTRAAIGDVSLFDCLLSVWALCQNRRAGLRLNVFSVWPSAALLCGVWPGPASVFNTWISLTSTFDVQSSPTLLLCSRKASNTEREDLYKSLLRKNCNIPKPCLMFILNSYLALILLVSLKIPWAHLFRSSQFNVWYTQTKTDTTSQSSFICDSIRAVFTENLQILCLPI